MLGLPTISGYSMLQSNAKFPQPTLCHFPKSSFQTFHHSPTPPTLPPHYFFLRFYLFIFRQKEREGDIAGEKHQCVVASHVLPTGDPAHNPTENQTCHPLVCRLALNPLSHTSQGYHLILKKMIIVPTS